MHLVAGSIMAVRGESYNYEKQFLHLFSNWDFACATPSLTTGRHKKESRIRTVRMHYEGKRGMMEGAQERQRVREGSRWLEI